MATQQERKLGREDSRTGLLIEEIQGLVTHPNNRRQQPFLVWDVSESGVGIWVGEQLRVGEQLVLTVGQPYLLIINCQVNWCERNEKTGGYRCGLRVTEQDKVFESLYKAFLKVAEKREKLA